MKVVPLERRGQFRAGHVKAIQLRLLFLPQKPTESYLIKKCNYCTVGWKLKFCQNKTRLCDISGKRMISNCGLLAYVFSKRQGTWLRGPEYCQKGEKICLPFSFFNSMHSFQVPLCFAFSAKHPWEEMARFKEINRLDEGKTASVASCKLFHGNKLTFLLWE